jgi:thymidine kinase
MMDNMSTRLTGTSSPLQKVDTNEAQYLQSLAKLCKRGRIELIMGPMFAGKSTELLRRVHRLEISGKTCLMVKFSADCRYSDDCISTHDK